MKFLCDLADKHGVTLNLFAKAYTEGRMTTRRLMTWYVSLGFKNLGGTPSEGYEMVRKKAAPLVLSSKRRVVPIDKKSQEGIDTRVKIKY